MDEIIAEPVAAEEPVVYPPGEYCILELFGHTTLVGRIQEVERFGAKMLAIAPLFKRRLLGVVFHGGASIYRLTPCSAAIAFDRSPTQDYELPPTIRATVPIELLPVPEAAPFHRFHDPDDDESF